MKIIKSLLIAFSLYSRIPVPQFDWEEDEYGHAISFLPFVGLVMGLIQVLVYRVCMAFEVPMFVTASLLCVVPLLFTGGFHLDGYMDVCDALGSYSGRERSLEIMKDPHIGAFAVIGLVRFCLLYFMGVYLLMDASADGLENGIYIYAALAVLVRAMCGISSILLPKAKDNGMLNMEASASGNADFYFLSFQGVLAGIYILLTNIVAGALVLAVLFFFCLYYLRLCEKRFGGVTGDTAGFFICRGELFGLLAIAVYYFVVRI